MKKVIKVLIVMVTLFLFVNSVNASIETSFAKCFVGFNIDYRNDINLEEISGNSLLGTSTGTGRTHFKISSDVIIDDDCSGDEFKYQEESKILYCADGTKVSPADDIKDGNYAADKVPFKNCKVLTKNDKSIAYVYENAYGNYKTNYSATDYLTGDYQKDYYITQTAIWYFTKSKSWMNNFDYSKGTYEGKTNEVITKITKLITDAQNASNGAKLKIESSDTKLNLTSDNKYYISAPMKLIGNYIDGKITATVEGTDGAFVTTNKDATSGEKSFDNNSTIYIKIPIESIKDKVSVTLNVSATTMIENAEIIECNHTKTDAYQPVIIYYPHNKTINDSKTVSLSTYTVKISKRSITSSDELKGAKLKITDKDGNVIEDSLGENLEWTSTETPRTFSLTPGDYILSETIAPEGYELSETTIEFTINNDGKVLIDGKEVTDNLIIFENTPKPEQVPTGNAVIYVAGTLCLAALGISIYIIIKRKEL